MRRWLLVLTFVAGCPSSPSDVGVDTDTDTVDTDTDTVVDTDDDTFTIDTSWNVDDTDTDVVDTDATFDTADTVDDTANCKFGEIEDCNGECFPEYFKGDGYCDDGTALPADFDCAVHNFDAGDCELDSDVPSAGCELTLQFVAVGSGGEVGWRIVEAGTNQNLYEVSSGAYSSNTTYTQTLFLEEGSYQFIGTDTFSDGWEGGYWVMTYEATGQLVAEGRDFTGGSSRSWLFNVDCDTTGCNMDIVTVPGTDPEDMGWELYTGSGRNPASLIPSTLPAGSTAPVTRSATVYNGTYTLRLRDSQLDGWEGGGVVEARMDGGFLVGVKAINSGGAGSLAFVNDCALAAEPAADDAGPPIEPTDCSRVAFEMLSTTTAVQNSYEVLRVNGWTRALYKPPGSFTDNSSRVDNITVQTGRYVIAMNDSGRNGWNGSRLRIRDLVTNTTMLTTTMPVGSSTAKYVDVVCPVIVDTDVPVDTDETDVPAPECLPGSQPDCAGICFPNAFIGDGNCDNGTLFSADFDCPRFNRDGGDCATP